MWISTALTILFIYIYLYLFIFITRTLALIPFRFDDSSGYVHDKILFWIHIRKNIGLFFICFVPFAIYIYIYIYNMQNPCAMGPGSRPLTYTNWTCWTCHSLWKQLQISKNNHYFIVNSEYRGSWFFCSEIENQSSKIICPFHGAFYKDDIGQGRKITATTPLNLSCKTSRLVQWVSMIFSRQASEGHLLKRKGHGAPFTCAGPFHMNLTNSWGQQQFKIWWPSLNSFYIYIYEKRVLPRVQSIRPFSV